MHSLISLYLPSGKKLFCAFPDSKKAFDTVWKIGLWQKLIKNKISGKMFRVILNLYTDIKSCVKNGDLHSNFFACETGVRQAKSYPPFYLPCTFMYLNDLEEYLRENSVNRLEFLNENCIQHIGMYLKLFLLLYADDTFILAESDEDLKAALNIFEEYCSEWKPSINVSKTKIVVF